MDIDATTPLTQLAASYYAFFAGRLSAGFAAGVFGLFLLAFFFLRGSNPNLDFEEMRASQGILPSYVTAIWTTLLAFAAFFCVTGAVISIGVWLGWFPRVLS